MLGNQFRWSISPQRTALRFAVPVAVLLGLAGCPVTQVNQMSPSAPLQHPETLVFSGDFKHASSGFLFPAKVDAFQRVVLLRYDTGSLDVSAGYNDAVPGCLVALTIYVYPTPHMTFLGADPDVVRSMEAQWLESGYEGSKREIMHAHGDAILESEDSKTQDGVAGKKAVYAIGSAQSELFIFVVEHAWYLKYRASYPKECAAPARQALGAFFAAWKGFPS
jgi:hypothetical protein